MNQQNTALHPAYVAGLFDGEGCVQVKFGTPAGRSLLCGLEISNSHRGVLEKIQSVYGGRIYGMVKKPARSRVRVFRYRVVGDNADALAAAILPYAVIKRSQLELFVQARKLVKPFGGTFPAVTTEEIAARQAMITRVSAAKSDGIAAW